MSSVEDPCIERTYIKDNVFIQQVKSCESKNCNVLIVQGGLSQVGHVSPYAKTFINFLPTNVRSFLYGQFDPMVKQDHAHRLHEVLVRIKESFPGEPLCVVGFSAGGFFVSTYLSFGYDDADKYFLSSMPFSMKRAFCLVKKNSAYAFVIRQTLKDFNCKNLQEIFDSCDLNMKEEMNKEKDMWKRLCALDVWKTKVVITYGSCDPFIGKAPCKAGKGNTFIVKDGVHCSPEVVFTTSCLVSKVCPKVHQCFKFQPYLNVLKTVSSTAEIIRC